jgi:RNA polymerase sigma factor (sigma-70 family)
MPPRISQSKAHEIVGHLFRHESGRMVSVLTRIFGFAQIDIVEDIVQEALFAALRRWSYGTIPDNPSGWIMQTAKNLAIDHIRKEKLHATLAPSIAADRMSDDGGVQVQDEFFLESEIADDQLRMIFTCCHPALNRESQVALTLKTLCGFSTQEIAHAFLTQEATIAKRITRAKQKAREERIPFEVPNGPDLESRLNAVLNVLYLLFTEGYSASHGEFLVRRDLCDEAIRLTTCLVEHPLCAAPKTHALLALMCFHRARLDARVGSHGEMLLLSEQDRTVWDPDLIARGIKHLDMSAQGEQLSEYHLEAGIVAFHAYAKDYASTPWDEILRLYDLLIKIDDSPVIALNRAVAVSRVHGSEAGIRAVGAIRDTKKLSEYYLYHSVLAELYTESGSFAQAAESYRRAVALSCSESERTFLEQKLKQVEGFLSKTLRSIGAI